jgi:hypothetical protein
MAEIVYYDNNDKEVYRLDSSGIRMNTTYSSEGVKSMQNLTYYGTFSSTSGLDLKTDKQTYTYYQLTCPVKEGGTQYAGLNKLMFKNITFKGSYEISTIEECDSSYYFVILNEPVKTVTGTYVESVDPDLVYNDDTLAVLPAKA